MKTTPIVSQMPTAPLPQRNAAVGAQYTELNAQRQEATIFLTTREGDRISIRQSAVDRQLVTAGIGIADTGSPPASLLAVEHVQTQGLSFAVEGDLNSQELADLKALLTDLSSIASDFFAGNLKGAVQGALEIGDMGSINKLEATFSSSSLLSRHLAAGYHPLPALGDQGQDPLFEALLDRRQDPEPKPSPRDQWRQFLARLEGPLPVPARKREDDPAPNATQSARQMLHRGQKTLEEHPRLTPLLPSLADLAMDLARQPFAQGNNAERQVDRLRTAFADAFQGWAL